MKLERDLRFATAPLHERCVYATLFAARHSIADVLTLGRDPLVVAARALGVDRDEAAAELDRLRAAGLMGDGLTLLAGVRRSRATATAATESNPAELAAVRAALEAYTGSRRGLARELGCSEGALRAFAAGRRALGGDLLSALAAYLEVRTSKCVPELRTNECVPNAVSTHAGTHQVSTHFGTQPLSPSDSLSPSPESSVSSALSTAEKKSNVSNGLEGVGSGEREAAAAVRTECVPTADAGTQAAPLSLAGEPSKPRRQRRRAAEPAVDPVPPEGTVARRVYEAITTDVALGPIVAGPGDLAMRLAAICDGTAIDPGLEVISAGAWLLRNPGRWKDGAGGLLRWVKSSADRARSAPVPAPGTPREASAGPARIDYQGRRVVGAAGLPSADAWAPTDRDEEQEMLDRIAARTQPRTGGHNGR